MRHGPGLSIIVGAATGGVPGRSSPPVPLSRWERGNEGRAPSLVRLLGPAERYHAVPPGGRGAARQLGRSVGAGSSERRALGPDPQRARSDAIGDARGRLLPATAVECELPDRKSTRLNSSHGYISYAVFCLKKKKNKRVKTEYTK